MSTSQAEPGFDDVAHAAERLRGVAIHTPLLQSETLDALTGGRILLKAETLQRTGSFKIRGAYNRLKQLVETGRDKGGSSTTSSTTTAARTSKRPLDRPGRPPGGGEPSAARR